MLCVGLPTQEAHAMDKSMVEGAEYNQSNYEDKTIYGSVYSFDDLKSFELNKDYVAGGGLPNPVGNVKLTDKFDHTGTLKGGKCLSILGRNNQYNRIKILNALSNKPLSTSDIGKHFTVSAYVMSNKSCSIKFGLFSTIDQNKYATDTICSDTKNVNANEWTRYEFEFTVTKAFVDNGINSLGFSQNNGESSAEIYLDDIVVTYAGDAIIFDNLNSFSLNTDFTLGGGYPQNPENYILTSDENHFSADTDGKSFKFLGRTKVDNRVKFSRLMGDKFTDADIGKAFEVNVYVKSSVDTQMRLGVYGPTNTKYAYTPYDSQVYDVKENGWTKLTIWLTVDDYVVKNGINMIGIDQPSNVTVSDHFFVDDITVRKENYNFSNSAKMDSDEYFNNLPEGEILCSSDDFLNSLNSFNGSDKYKAQSISYAGWQEAYGFTKAVQYTVDEKPKTPQTYQHMIKNIGNESKKNDQLLVVCYIRGKKSNAKDGKCHIQFVIENGNSTKVLQSDYKALTDEKWQKCYFPTGKINDYTGELRLNIRCGYEVQQFDIADLKIIRYDAAKYPGLSYEDMPESISAPNGILPAEKWRSEAEERIKLTRMGKATVHVTDMDGNPLPGAKVDIDMKDHEFQFGSAVNSTILNNIKNYNDTIKGYFNTAVLESEHKWVIYDKDKTRARNIYNMLKNFGIKNVRGHALIWDKDYTKGWVDNSAVPKEVSDNYDNAQKLDELIEEHIKQMLTDFNGQISDWDVVNEIAYNHCIVDKYDKEPLLKWFSWARQYDPNAERYINEAEITGNGDDHLNKLCAYLDYMRDNNVEVDGIGLQSHFSSACDIDAFKTQLDRLASYGKRLKITEYDFNNRGNIQSDFTRDIMILAYSYPQIDGFLGWGFCDKYHFQNNAMLYDENWNLKDSGRQYVDLVFNNWWSDESGKTDDNGDISRRVFYGDYEVTVDYLGQTTKQTVSFNRGGNNDITVKVQDNKNRKGLIEIPLSDVSDSDEKVEFKFNVNSGVQKLDFYAISQDLGDKVTWNTAPKNNKTASGFDADFIGSVTVNGSGQYSLDITDTAKAKRKAGLDKITLGISAKQTNGFTSDFSDIVLKKVTSTENRAFGTNGEYVTGGSGGTGNCVVSKDYDRDNDTVGGKSLRLTKTKDFRYKFYNGLKSTSTLSQDDLGRKFKVSFSVLNPVSSGEATNMNVGFMSAAVGQTPSGLATNGYTFKGSTCKVQLENTGKWTDYSFDFEVTQEVIDWQAGMLTFSDTFKDIYVDNVKVTDVSDPVSININASDETNFPTIVTTKSDGTTESKKASKTAYIEDGANQDKVMPKSDEVLINGFRMNNLQIVSSKWHGSYKAGESFGYEASFDNNADSSINVSLITALYKADVLVDIDIKNKEFVSGQKGLIQTNISLPQDLSDEYYIKTYIWKGFDTMEPLGEFAEYPYSLSGDSTKDMNDFVLNYDIESWR